MKPGKRFRQSKRSIEEAQATGNPFAVAKAAKQFNARAALRDAEFRYRNRQQVDQNVMKQIALDMEIIDVLRSSGTTEEGGSIVFTRLLFDDDFWHKKLQIDFPDFYMEYDDYIAECKKFYFITRYILHGKLYPTLIAKSMANAQTHPFEFTAKLVDNSTNMIEVTYTLKETTISGVHQYHIMDYLYYYYPSYNTKKSLLTLFLEHLPPITRDLIPVEYVFLYVLILSGNYDETPLDNIWRSILRKKQGDDVTDYFEIITDAGGFRNDQGLLIIGSDFMLN